MKRSIGAYHFFARAMGHERGCKLRRLAFSLNSP